MEHLLRGHPLERPLDNVNLNRNVLISTPDKRPTHLKGHISDVKEVASQDRFYCMNICNIYLLLCCEVIAYGTICSHGCTPRCSAHNLWGPHIADGADKIWLSPDLYYIV